MKSSHLTPDNAQEAQELVSDISQLMAEVEEMLSESTSHHAEETVALFAEKPNPVDPLFMEKYVAAKGKFSALVRKTDATIRACPYEALAVTFGLGILIGAILRRRPGSRLSE